MNHTILSQSGHNGGCTATYHLVRFQGFKSGRTTGCSAVAPPTVCLYYVVRYDQTKLTSRGPNTSVSRNTMRNENGGENFLTGELDPNFT